MRWIRYQRLVEFNAMQRAQRRWGKVRLALKTVWSFNEPVRKQIEAERKAAAAARGYVSQVAIHCRMVSSSCRSFVDSHLRKRFFGQVAEEEAQLTAQLHAVHRQKEELFAGDRWMGKLSEPSRALLASEQRAARAAAWLQAGEDRRRQDAARNKGSV